MNAQLLRQLSKAASHALRHEPWLYELELDAEGWVAAGDLLSALRSEHPEWASLSEGDLAEMISQSEKQRHELLHGRIRALYGHSTPQRLLKEQCAPPGVLYHGTAPATAARIKAEGLKPMSRQYVHLSADVATAKQVGRRKASGPVVLTIEAGSAHAAGVAFYRGNDHVWLADFVPTNFVS